MAPAMRVVEQREVKNAKGEIFCYETLSTIEHCLKPMVEKRSTSLYDGQSKPMISPFSTPGLQ